MVLPLRLPALTNNLALTPPMGWNDWNSYGCSITESDITNTAYLIATNGMKAAGYQFVNIDDCGLSARDSNGVFVANPTKFPHGLKSLADFTHSLGLKQGVYSDRGTNTCAGFNQPGSYGYEYLDAMTYASWGADYLKEDNCKTVPGSSALADYGRMSDGLMKSGRPITFCLCGNNLNTQSKGFVSWSPALGNQWRTTGDIGDSYATMISHIDPNSTTAYVAGPGRWNDPDMLEVGRGGMTDTEYQTHFTMWCIMASPLIMGNVLTTMSAQSLATLTNPEAIAVDQDPAGEQGVKVVNNPSPIGTNEVWSRTLGYDFSTKAVVLFNRLGPATNITVNWTNLGLQAGSATVRDLWAHADLGTFTNSFTATIPSHGVGMYKIVGTPPVLPGPGTNYLTDLQAVYAYTGAGTIVKDKSISGNPITLDTVVYPKGLGVNSRAGADYDLGGVCSRFQATIGVDDEVGANGSVIFHVFADGWEIYNSGVMTGGTAARAIDLDVTGVNRLILGVGDADDGTSSDHADWANVLVIVTNSTPQPPHAPAGLMASPGNAVTLNWNTTLAATSYNVKRATNSGGPYTILTNVPLTTWTDGAVVAGTNYFYIVSAVNRIGESSNSAAVSAVPCYVPAAPTNVLASTGNAQAVVSWNTSAGATSYNVSRFTGGTPPVLVASGIATTNFTDNTVTNGTTYYYLVTAAGACNQSGYSAFAPAILPPAVPTGLGAAPGNAMVGLNWTASAGATGYNVKRSTTSGGPYALAVSNLAATTYSDTGLNNGTTYYYVVSGLNAGGESANSAEAGATPSLPPPPGAPTGLSATPASMVVSLSWTAPSGATGYNVKRSTTNGGPYALVVSNLATTAYLDTGLTNGTTYYYVVSGVNAGGEGTNSSQASATPFLPAPPDAPTGLSAIPGSTVVSLNWTAPTDATGYNVKRSTTSGGPYALVVSNLAATAYLDTTLNNGTTYYYVVSGVNAGGEGANSTQAGATPAGPATAYWTNTMTGTAQSWNLNGNWTNANAFPNTTGVLAVVNANITANQAINLNQVVTIGSLSLGDPNGSAAYTIAANGGTLAFYSTNAAVLNELAASDGDVISAPIVLGTNLIVINSSTNPLSLTGPISGTGAMAVNAGILALTATTGVSAISVAAGATFQMNGNYKGLTLTGAGTWNVNAGNGSSTATSFNITGNVSGFTGAANVPPNVRYWVGSQASMPVGTMFVANGGQLGISYNGLLTGNVHISGASWAGTGGENDGALRLNSGTGTGGNFAGTLTLDNDAAVAGGITSGTGTVSANIGGAHTLTILNGTITLSGTNAFGALNVPAGSTVIAGSTSAFGGGGLAANGVVVLNGLSLSVANLTGSGFVGNNHASLVSTLTAGSDGTSTIFSGALMDGSTAALGLVKTGTGTLTLAGTNTQSGATAVNSGVLMVSGALAGIGPVSVASAGTLGGNGAIAGAITVDGTLAPGTNGIGTLTCSNSLALHGGSTTVMEINKSAVPSNSVVQVTGGLVYAGTLVITNTGATAYAAGDSFKLFNAAGYSGGFTNVAPAIPALNLAWNTNALANGILGIVALPTPPPKFRAVACSGNSATFSGTNGVPNWPYVVRTSTNVALPLSGWTVLATNRFDAAGNFTFTHTNAPYAPNRFYSLELR